MISRHLLVVVLQLATIGNDAYWTNVNRQRANFQEHNPLIQPFSHTQNGIALYFAGNALARLAVPAILRHKGHNRIAELGEWEGIADHGVNGTVSAIERKQ